MHADSPKGDGRNPKAVVVETALRARTQKLPDNAESSASAGAIWRSVWYPTHLNSLHTCCEHRPEAEGRLTADRVACLGVCFEELSTLSAGNELGIALCRA